LSPFLSLIHYLIYNISAPLDGSTTNHSPMIYSSHLSVCSRTPSHFHYTIINYTRS
jgi:hypothetical protein